MRIWNISKRQNLVRKDHDRDRPMVLSKQGISACATIIWQFPPTAASCRMSSEVEARRKISENFPSLLPNIGISFHNGLRYVELSDIKSLSCDTPRC